MSNQEEQLHFTIEDLVTLNYLTPEMSEAVLHELDHTNALIIAGMAASGRTTLLNALLQKLPREERIATISFTCWPSKEQDLIYLENTTASFAKDASGQASQILGALRRGDTIIAIDELQRESGANLADATMLGTRTLATLHATSPEDAISYLHRAFPFIEPLDLKLSLIYLQTVAHQRTRAMQVLRPYDPTHIVRQLRNLTPLPFSTDQE